MVENPTHSARARDAAAMLLGSRDGGACADVDQANEEFFEPVHLVPHAVDLNSRSRQLRKNVVQTLPLRNFDLERMVVGKRGPESFAAGELIIEDSRGEDSGCEVPAQWRIM